MTDNLTYETVQFDLFPPGKRFMKDVGMALVKIEHGLVSHYVDFNYSVTQQLPDGGPDLAKIAVLSHLHYEIDTHISVIAKALKDSGYFSDKTEVSTTFFDENQNNVVLLNWSEDMEETTFVDLVQPFSDKWDRLQKLLHSNGRLARYLYGILLKLEKEGKEFTGDWYRVKILHLYFQSFNVSLDSAFSIGILHEQMYWRFQHESDAVSGQKNQLARDAAELAKPIKAAERKSAMLECVARLWHEAKNELGQQAMRMDTNASQAIFALAEKEKPLPLLVKKTGKVKGPDAIRRLLPELRSLGKID